MAMYLESRGRRMKTRKVVKDQNQEHTSGHDLEGMQGRDQPFTLDRRGGDTCVLLLERSSWEDLPRPLSAEDHLQDSRAQGAMGRRPLPMQPGMPQLGQQFQAVCGPRAPAPLTRDPRVGSYQSLAAGGPPAATICWSLSKCTPHQKIHGCGGPT